MIKLPSIRQIKIRITINVSIIVIAVIVVVTALISMIYYQKINEQTSIIAKQKMKIIINDFEEEIAKIIELHNTIQDNDEVQELLSDHPRTEEDRYKNKALLSKILRQYAYTSISANSIFAFSLDKVIYDPLYSISPYKEIVAEYELFDRFIESDKYSAFSPPSTFPRKIHGSKEKDKQTITYFSKYIDENNFIQIGYLLINIKKDYIFRNIIRDCKEEFDFAYIVDEKGNVILQVGETSLDEQSIKEYGLGETKNRELKKINNMNFYIITEPLRNYSDWILVGGLSYNSMQEGAKLILNIVYIIGIVSILVVIILSFLLSKKITDPILEMNNAMKEFEQGKWPSELSVTTNDELKTLVDGFNKMVLEFRNLIDRVEKEHDELKRVEVNALELKLELLQSQINPHFVHNTLNAIQYLAYKKDAEDIREAINAFNMLLRASMSVGKDFIKIREELACVSSYLKICKYRYDNEVELVLNVEEELVEMPLPKLILQPLVENSIYHGILTKNEKGIIQINIRKNDTTILIEVIDDGIGIPQEKLIEMLEGDFIKKDNQEDSSGFNNIGLKNINDRLKLYFGEAYTLKIASDVGIGTCVFFEMPIIKKEG